MSVQERAQSNHSPLAQHDHYSESEGHSSADECVEEGKEEREPEEVHLEGAVPHHVAQDFHKKKEGGEGFTTQFEAFKKAFEEELDLGVRLQLAINFMEDSLAQGGAPHFRSFWEARRLCLSLFRENISPILRSQLWTKYSELSKEARRLKEILDEQSAFAVEQIEIAVRALEEDIAQFDEQAHKATDLPEFLVFPQALRQQYGAYQNLQRQLNILNAQASRINALRKELLKTEMRVRYKNKFFQHLSVAGDKVFPRRKEFIRQMSHQFAEDVDQFIKVHSGERKSQESLYFLREEIKALQGLAKVLTLNTQAFTETRTRLSEYWDEIKIEEKERKKERAQQRLLFKQNQEEIAEKIRHLKESVEKEAEVPKDAQKQVENIIAWMRKVELGRDELKALRDALGEVRKLIQEKFLSEEDARRQQQEERDRQKKEKYWAFKAQIESLIQQHEAQSADELTTGRDAILEQIHSSSLAKNEKQELERLFKPLRDIITEKIEKAMMTLSDDDRQALQQLQHISQQRKERRQEIKEQLEALRKTAGSSSLDFEKAMSCTMQIGEEKERLEKANQAIQEIEQKITSLQTKMRGR